MKSLLFNVAAVDSGSMAAASLIIFAAGFAGCTIPALRALRVDPAVALRYD